MLLGTLKAFIWKHFSVNLLHFAFISSILFIVSPTSADIAGCAYNDTVNITESTLLANGSRLYKEKYIILPDQFGWYENEIIFNNKTEKVDRHLRGCLCKFFNCIQLCCPLDEVKKEKRNCIASNSSINMPYINITNDNGTAKEYNIFTEFVIQPRLPCDFSYRMKTFVLFENGSLEAQEIYDAGILKLYSKNEYCILNNEFPNIALVCGNDTKPEVDIKSTINKVAKLISIPFLLITIFVYAAIPELRNLNGKCLISHLTTLTMSFIFFSIDIVVDVNEEGVPYTLCKYYGYFAYYFVIASFVWLGIISFDMWNSLRSPMSALTDDIQRRNFRYYSLLAWSLPCLFVGLTMWGQETITNSELNPRIGEVYCWFNINSWSPMLFLYGPMGIIILFNMTVFILTTKEIYKVRKELSRFCKDANKDANKDAYTMYLRLFVVMGISWLFEIISYLKDFDVFIVTDILNGITGIILFVLFVIKPKVLLLIKKRFNCKKPASPKTIEKNQLSDRSIKTSQLSGESSTRDTDL